MIAQFATPVTTICMNHVLLFYLGEVGVNFFSIISYVASFTMSVLFGCSEGLQPLFGQSYGAKDEKSLKYYFRAGIFISLIGSVLIVSLTVFFDQGICALFGADAETLAFTVQSMPFYVWGFIIAGMNILISAYFYSTKRSAQAIALNTLRSLVVNIVVILALPAFLGSGIVWYTFGIYESIVLVFAIIFRNETALCISSDSPAFNENRKIV